MKSTDELEQFDNKPAANLAKKAIKTGISGKRLNRDILKTI